MKELSIEEKAKRYDEILARAEGANLPYYKEEIMSKVKEFVDYLLPELKESEDERIRKELLNAFQEAEDSLYMVLTPNRRKSFIAWLEKQGEHQKFRDSIQVGDKVTRNKNGVLVNLSQLNRVAKKDNKQGEQIDLVNKEYWRGYREGKQEILDKYSELEKQSEKGTNGNEREIPNSEQKPTGKVEPIEWSGKIKSRKVEGVLKKMLDEKIKSADKVEPKFKVGDKIRKKTPSSFDRDMQVARIEKDYYVCNHIGKFSSEVVSFSKESSYELIEQTPAWSKEDKVILDEIIDFFENGTVKLQHDLSLYASWFKSLKDRVQPQPKQEWSEEDEETLKIIDRDLQEFYSRRKAQAGSPLFESQMQNIRWLKSLKDRVGCEVICTTMWKPSDEQMAALMSVASGFEVTEKTKEHLKELFVELKKLREE